MRILNNCKLFLLFGLAISMYILSGCKETIIEPKETIVIRDSLISNVIYIDTLVGTPYTWSHQSNGQVVKMIALDQSIFPVGHNYIIDVYWGSPGPFWLALPYIDSENQVYMNYQWTASTLFVFAYGDTTKTSDKAYWDRIGYDWLKLKITKVE